MTSLEGKAFYNTDCFIPCGEVSHRLIASCRATSDRGLAFGRVGASCLRTAIQSARSKLLLPSMSASPPATAMGRLPAGSLLFKLKMGYRFVVANPDRPYATCVPDHQMDAGSSGRRITNQSAPKLHVSARDKDKANSEVVSRSDRKRPQLAKRASGRRLRKSANLGSGPAVALLEHAGEDPFALVSK